MSEHIETWDLYGKVEDDGEDAEKRIGELEAALKEIWALYDETEPTPTKLNAALYEARQIAGKALRKDDV